MITEQEPPVAIIGVTRLPFWCVWGPLPGGKNIPVTESPELVPTSYRREVEGYPVELRGWEEFEFYIWKTDGDVPQWSLTERLTGLSVSLSDYVVPNTRMEAIEVGLYRLEKAGKEKLHDLLDEWIPKMAALPER